MTQDQLSRSELRTASGAFRNESRETLFTPVLEEDVAECATVGSVC